MILYHGTSAAAVSNILEHGIVPRRITGVPATSQAQPGHPDCVYLAHGYASVFAAEAVLKQGNDFKEEAAILEIDTALLDKNLFVPDEFVIAQVVAEKQAAKKGKRHEPFDKIMANARKLMTSQNSLWRGSLMLMGSCAYNGIVPPDAIKRVSYIDFKKMDFRQECDVLDVVVSVTAYQILANKYRMIDAWMFGGSVIFGFGVIPEHQLKSMPDFDKRRDEFDQLWSDRSVVRVVGLGC